MKKLITSIAVGRLATLPSWAADTVELLPGKIAGTLSLSSETIKNGQIYANATDGSGSAIASFTGSSYSILVPAGKTWKLNFKIYPEVPAVSGAQRYISVNLPTELTVRAAETVTIESTDAAGSATTVLVPKSQGNSGKSEKKG